MFMLCIAQIGPAPILVPAVIWMFMGDNLAGAIFLLVVSILAIGMDNVLRPILIRKGADLPLLLIFAGVIGGLMAFGLIGIFLGPTILAIGYTLLGAWVAEGEGSAVLDPGAASDRSGSDTGTHSAGTHGNPARTVVRAQSSHLSADTAVPTASTLHQLRNEKAATP